MSARPPAGGRQPAFRRSRFQARSLSARLGRRLRTSLPMSVPLKGTTAKTGLRDFHVNGTRRRHEPPFGEQICAFRADAAKIGLAGRQDEPGGLCDSTDLLQSLSGAVLRPSAPRQRVPSLRARHRPDAELRAGHGRKTCAERLHLGSIFDSRRGRRRESRCLAASDVRLHPSLAGGNRLTI